MNIVKHFTSADKPWGKSKTPKRYLHPPLSEHLVTLWRNGMIIMGETQGGDGSQKSGFGRFNESTLPSVGMAFVYKLKLIKAEPIIETREDAIPIHAQSCDLGKMNMRMECFCSCERVCTTYTKLTLKNTTDKPIIETVGLLSRVGFDLDLIGSNEPDGYVEIEPSVFRWQTLPYWNAAPTYSVDRSTNCGYKVFYQYDERVKYVPNDFYPRFEISLNPGEETDMFFALGRNKKVDEKFNYQEEQQKTIDFWNKEFSRIKNMPDENDKELVTITKSLVAQILQMFAYPKGCNYVMVRQGGIQRLVWPTEARSGIRALAEIGDFEDYLDKAFKTYFCVMQSTDKENYGEIVNFGIPWGSVTGAVLYAFGCAIKNCPNLYKKYKDYAFDTFLWMERMREKTKKDPKLVSGIFPPLRSSDYAADGQMWADTDVWNLQAYGFYLKGLKANNDSNYERVKEAREDYFASMKVIMDNAIKGQENNDIIYLPSEAHNNPETEREIEKKIFSKKAECFRLLGIGLAGYGTEIAEKILRRYYNEKEVENGLVCSFQPSDVDGGKRWYVSFYEMDLYDYFRNSGQDEKAKELLDAQYNYSMTKEYYMAERYDDHDPYYLPWCPNCSANGRTISMTLNWYKK